MNSWLSKARKNNELILRLKARQVHTITYCNDFGRSTPEKEIFVALITAIAM